MRGSGPALPQCKTSTGFILNRDLYHLNLAHSNIIPKRDYLPYYIQTRESKLPGKISMTKLPFQSPILSCSSRRYYFKKQYKIKPHLHLSRYPATHSNRSTIPSPDPLKHGVRFRFSRQRFRNLSGRHVRRSQYSRSQI